MQTLFHVNAKHGLDNQFLIFALLSLAPLVIKDVLGRIDPFDSKFGLWRDTVRLIATVGCPIADHVLDILGSVRREEIQVTFLELENILRSGRGKDSDEAEAGSNKQSRFHFSFVDASFADPYPFYIARVMPVNLF